MKQSDDSYNGRSLDENVVNPFLKANEVPCSAGPFLSVFRRNIKFELATERGVKDKEAFRAMLTFIGELNKSDEREVQKFHQTISPNQIENYLFLHSTAEPTSEAKVLAKTYFAVGHEINFLPTIDWVLIILTALGNKGREYFIQNLLNLLDQSHIPATLKVAWNRHLQAII